MPGPPTQVLPYHIQGPLYIGLDRKRRTSLFLPISISIGELDVCLSTAYGLWHYVFIFFRFDRHADWCMRMYAIWVILGYRGPRCLHTVIEAISCVWHHLSPFQSMNQDDSKQCGLCARSWSLSRCAKLFSYHLEVKIKCPKSEEFF